MELFQLLFSLLRHRLNPFATDGIVQLKDQPDQLVRIHKGKYSQEGQTEDDSCNPGSRHTAGVQVL